uniref:Uncharacterized protein n=1 Tax=Oryza nivara TaxID=4536 RepID=A0A0E0GIS5_ORYNI
MGNNEDLGDGMHCDDDLGDGMHYDEESNADTCRNVDSDNDNSRGYNHYLSRHAGHSGHSASNRYAMGAYLWYDDAIKAPELYRENIGTNRNEIVTN